MLRLNIKIVKPNKIQTIQQINFDVIKTNHDFVRAMKKKEKL